LVVVGRRIDYCSIEVEGAGQVAVLQPALLVEVRQAVDDEVAADEVEVVAELLQISDEGIMTRQFRQP
jgi:hypothetical protein